MERFKRYRNKSALDTDLVAMSVADQGDSLLVNGYLIHRMFGYVYDSETYTILKQDLWKWKYVQD